MLEKCTYDYAIIRVVPRVEREEFVNVGVIVSCPDKEFLEARIEFDEDRLLALEPKMDLETVRTHLDTFVAICAGGRQAGPIGTLPQRERFRWLVAPRSTVIQVSAVHAGRCTNPELALGHLLTTMVSTGRDHDSPVCGADDGIKSGA